MSQSKLSYSTHGTSLIGRLQQQDSIAWQQMVELYAPLIFHWCKQCRLDSADSADVMQEVFAAASKKMASFQAQPGGTLRGWLWTITQNKVRDHVRRQKHRPLATGGTEAHIRLANVPGETPISEADDYLRPPVENMDLQDEPTTELESHQLLHRALDQIRADFLPHNWSAFWRSVVDGHETDHISEDLGMTPNRVRQAKRRILRRLRQQLGDAE